MGIKNTLKNVGKKTIDFIEVPGVKEALVTGLFGIATAGVNLYNQKLANDTANKNLLAVKYQARMGGYDQQLRNGLKDLETEGKEDNKTEGTEKKEEK